MVRPPTFAERLANMRKRFIGDFGTGLFCNCGRPAITDRATDHDPNACPPSLSEMRIGPGPDDFTRLQNFKVYHEYFCSHCGTVYKNEVIEGFRKYVPQEKRPEESSESSESTRPRKRTKAKRRNP